MSRNEQAECVERRWSLSETIEVTCVGSDMLMTRLIRSKRVPSASSKFFQRRCWSSNARKMRLNTSCVVPQDLDGFHSSTRLISRSRMMSLAVPSIRMRECSERTAIGCLWILTAPDKWLVANLRQPQATDFGACHFSTEFLRTLQKFRHFDSLPLNDVFEQNYE